MLFQQVNIINIVSAKFARHCIKNMFILYRQNAHFVIYLIENDNIHVERQFEWTYLNITISKKQKKFTGSNIDVAQFPSKQH